MFFTKHGERLLLALFFLVILIRPAFGVADLAITKSDAPDPVQPGNTYSYTILVTNLGPDAATGITITDNLPPEVTFFSVTSLASCVPSGLTVTCQLANLNLGQVAAVTLLVEAPGDEITVTNTATVTSPSDPNPANDSFTIVTGIQNLEDDDGGCSSFSLHGRLKAGKGWGFWTLFCGVIFLFFWRILKFSQSR